MARDLYTDILEIPPGERPPDLYALLGVECFEGDGAAIHRAGLNQMRRLKEWELHPDTDVREQVQELLNDVGGALSILESVERRAEYDQALADSRGVALSGDGGYHALTAVPLGKACPNCGASMSEVASRCIECGFDHRLGRVVEEAGKALGAAIAMLPTVAVYTGQVGRKCPRCQQGVELADETCGACGAALRRRPRLHRRSSGQDVGRTRGPGDGPAPPGPGSGEGGNWGMGLVGAGRTGAKTSARGRTTRGCLVFLLLGAAPFILAVVVALVGVVM